MTNEDILAHIDECRLQASLNTDAYLRSIKLSALDSCEAAVRKQIPKKPIECIIGNTFAYRCSCGHLISLADHYCSFCGQAADWDAVKEN